MGIFLSVLLIAAILAGCRFLVSALLDPQAAGGRSVRAARHTLIARQAMQDIDRKYEELLRS